MKKSFFAGRIAAGISRVFNVVAVAATSLLTFNACGDLDEDFQARVTVMEDDTEVVPGYAVERSLTHSWDSVARTSITDAMTAPMTIWQTEDGQKVGKVYENTARPVLNITSALSQYDYNIVREQLDIVPMDYQLKRGESVATDGAALELDTCVWHFADAQIFTIPVKISTYSVEVAGTTYQHGSLTLVSAQFVSLTNTERSTRAQYVANNYDTEYLAKLLFREKNVSNPQDFTVFVHQYAVRHLLEDDAVKERKVENQDRVVVDATTERCSFDIVSIYKSGETTRESHQIILNRLFKGIDAYNKDVENFDYAYVSNNGVKVGTASQARTEGSWTVSGRTDGYGANLRNGVSVDNVVTSYTLYHEAAVYQDGDLKVDFGFESVNVTEVQTKVTGATSSREGYDKAILSNEIGTTYMGYVQNLNEQVNLFKAKPVVVVTEEFRNANLVTTREKFIASLSVVTLTDGKVSNSENFSLEIPCSDKVLTNWSVAASNSSQTTGAATVKMVRTENRTEGEWSFVYEVRNINTTASLTGSSQQNGWESIIPNDIVFSHNGKTYKFDKVSFTSTEAGSNVAKAGEDAFETTYSYTDKINVRYGDASFEMSAPGTIHVEKAWTPDFPTEWGKFTGIKFTNARNEAKNTWVYVMSVHFQNGTLPLIVRNDFSAPEVNLGYFENDTNAALNSASWVPAWGKWTNTVAANESGYMTWLTSAGVGADAYTYTAATAINWDFGAVENGHPSVYCNRFSAEITREGSLLTIYKDGKVFAQYKAVR